MSARTTITPFHSNSSYGSFRQNQKANDIFRNSQKKYQKKFEMRSVSSSSSSEDSSSEDEKTSHVYRITLEESEYLTKLKNTVMTQTERERRRFALHEEINSMPESEERHRKIREFAALIPETPVCCTLF